MICLLLCFHHVSQGKLFNPFAPRNFARKRVLKLAERFRSLSCQKENHLQVVHFAAFWSRCKILACDFRAGAESKKIVLGFKSDPAVLTYFLLSLLPSSFVFLASFFVVCWACSILGLDKRKSRWVVKQDFGFLPFSPGSFTESCSFWYGLKDLFTLRKLPDKAILDR